LARGEITVLAAPGGVGKSSLAIGMSASLAVGQETLEEKIWD
jgi:RecA-family ATPase